MYLKTFDESECCGCSACEQICPRNCITMKPNEEGFLYPVVDETQCIHCSLCEKVCPVANYERKEQEDICYYGWHKENEIRLKSTSGAAFVGLAQVCAEKGYHYFFGAEYDENLKVHHVGIYGLDNLDKLRCSKYVQSDMGNCYAQIKALVQGGEKVVFSGTPCQVDGLEHFLGKLATQVFTIALVCHGCSSPAVFQSYLKEEAAQIGSQIESIKFRDKRETKEGKLSHRFTTLKTASGKVFASTENIYTQIFGIGVADRLSCYSCPYTNESGAGDVTIGDFWGIEQFVPSLKDEVSNGISLIIPHTEKGNQAVQELNQFMEICPVPLKYALNDRQRQLLSPIELPRGRKWFIKHILCEKRPFYKESKKAIYLWKLTGYKKRLIRKIQRCIRGKN